MTEADEKQNLHRYLHRGRDALVWKLDGLSDYDIRRPLPPTGTNLLGLVKHCAGVEWGYFGQVPWWPEERKHPTLHTVLLHVIHETARHVGHADIIRESIDGAAGMLPGVSNMPEADADAWQRHYDKLQRIAQQA